MIYYEAIIGAEMDPLTSRIENPETDLHIYGVLKYYEWGIPYQWKNEGQFNKWNGYMTKDDFGSLCNK